MKRELNELKKAVEGTNKTLARVLKTVEGTNGMLHRTMISLAQLRGDFEEFKPTVATRRDISDLNGRMDGFSGLLLDTRHRWAIHADTLEQHDKRLNKLENKPA